MAVSPRYEPGQTIDELFREHRARVLAICRSLLDDPTDAEDATQQVFLAAFRALAGGTAPRSPEAWLAAIARNECRARARSRQPTASAGVEFESLDGDPAALVVSRSEVAALWAAIAQLPPSQRKAILLREVHGLSYAELADDLQLTRPSIRSLLSRARQAIRARLGDGGAALGGVSWLESLTRLMAGGSTPAAIATKTAAVGLGAAAITGGAIVAPELTPHPRPHPHRVAAVVVHPLPAAVGRVHLKPADPVERSPAHPVRHVGAPELVVATPVVHRSHHEVDTPQRIEHPRITHVAEHDGDRAARPPVTLATSLPTSGPEPRTDGGGSGEGESSRGSGTTPVPVASPAITGEAMTRVEPTDGEGGTTATVEAVTPVPTGSDGSDGSHGSDGPRQFTGSDGSGGGGD